MSLILVSRNPENLSISSTELLRFHGEYTTADPEGIVRIGENIPDLFFPNTSRNWVVTESFKGIIERELEAPLFEPAFCNRLIEDPGDMDLAVAQTKHEAERPPHGVLDYFMDVDRLHRACPAMYWMRIPLFGTGEFLPEVTEQIVKCNREHLFLNERAYQKFVSCYFTDDLIERYPIFTLHSSLALADWLFDYLEPVIDFRYYQVSTVFDET